VIPVQNAASPVLLHRLHHPVAFEPFLDVSNDVGGAPDAIGHSSFLPVPSRPTPPHKHYLNSHNTLSPTDNQPYNKPLRYQYTVITRSACQRVNAHTSHDTRPSKLKMASKPPRKQHHPELPSRERLPNPHKRRDPYRTRPPRLRVETTTPKVWAAHTPSWPQESPTESQRWPRA
jgi:hypothetical protein